MSAPAGRVLHVDLSTGERRLDWLPEAGHHQWLGGRGLAAWLLRDTGGIAWDDPAMPMVLAAGALTPGMLPMAGRATVSTKSPLTGTIRHAPTGGLLSAALHGAGLAAVVLSGKGERPCVVRIAQGEGSAQDGAVLLEMDGCARVGFLQQSVRKAPYTAVLSTGPAAHAGSPFASLMTEQYIAVPGGGLGLALAAKHCVGIIISGSAVLAVQDDKAVLRLKESFLRSIHAAPALAGAAGIGLHGDGALFDLLQHRRMLATRNFRETFFATPQGLGARAYAGPRELGTIAGGLGCSACPVPCQREDGAGLLPDLVAMAGFSALIGNEDKSLVVHALRRCQALGLDVWEAAAAVAGCLEHTAETATETAVLPLLDALGRGELLPGHAEAGMRVKGMALAPMDPRGAFGLALAMAVGVQGPDPEACVIWHQELLRKPVAVDRFSWAGKARMVAHAENLTAVAQALGLCSHALLAIGLEEMAQALEAVAGWKPDAHSLVERGAAIVALDRAFHRDAGFSHAGDILPDRFFTEPIADRPGGNGQAVSCPPLDKQAFLAERHSYYRLRGEQEAKATLEAGASPLRAQLEQAAQCLVNTGLVQADAGGGQGPLTGPIIAASDVGVVWNREFPDEASRQFWQGLFDGTAGATLIVARPAGAYCIISRHLAGRALQEAGDEAAALCPSDSETRLFLTDIPVLQCDSIPSGGTRGSCDPEDIARVTNALSTRKGCIVLDAGGGPLVIATGAVTPAQAAVTVSSILFACFVQFFVEALGAARQGGGAGLTRREREVLAAATQALHPLAETAPPLMRGPFENEAQARAAMAQAGRATVQLGLVDSCFGNISYLVGSTLHISQTGAALDQLEDAIDACPIDACPMDACPMNGLAGEAHCQSDCHTPPPVPGTTGMTASSECSAHQAVIAQVNTGAPIRAILHGHPPFAVILSMDCPGRAPGANTPCAGAGACHLRCPERRTLGAQGCGDIPVVAGEVGTGPTGLVHTMPPALAGRKGAMVFGHGLFVAAPIDFNTALATLLEVERASRREVFRRLAQFS